VNYHRAGDCDSPEAKAKFFELAREYADLALRLDDPTGARSTHRTLPRIRSTHRRAGIRTRAASRDSKTLGMAGKRAPGGLAHFRSVSDRMGPTDGT
jgi:hypothetical protein